MYNKSISIQLRFVMLPQSGGMVQHGVPYLWHQLGQETQFPGTHVHPFLRGNLATLGLPANLYHL